MGLNEDLIELSAILTDEQPIEYVLRLTLAENQFMKDIEDIMSEEITCPAHILNG